VASVRHVTELVGEIAVASQEQSQGISQVNAAMGQMEHVVQQNAALVEEASAATESMRDEAAALLERVSRFELGDSAAPPAWQARSRPVATRALARRESYLIS
jgi:methyl-accepting chemotaxis protein